jgi:hypothetical protein
LTLSMVSLLSTSRVIVFPVRVFTKICIFAAGPRSLILSPGLVVNDVGGIVLRSVADVVPFYREVLARNAGATETPYADEAWPRRSRLGRTKTRVRLGAPMLRFKAEPRGSAQFGRPSRTFFSFFLFFFFFFSFQKFEQF